MRVRVPAQPHVILSAARWLPTRSRPPPWNPAGVARRPRRRRNRDPRTPGGSSRVRLAALVVFPGLVIFSVLEPRLAGRVFWTVAVASLPLLFVLAGYHRWRRICPLAFVSQLPTRFGWGGTPACRPVAAGARLSRRLRRLSRSRCGCGSSRPTATATPSRRSCSRCAPRRSASASRSRGRPGATTSAPSRRREAVHGAARPARHAELAVHDVHGVPARLPRHQRGEQLLEGDRHAGQARRLLRVSRRRPGVLPLLLPAGGHLELLLQRRAGRASRDCFARHFSPGVDAATAGFYFAPSCRGRRPRS